MTIHDKIAEVVKPYPGGVKLPGVEAATGSTIIHFMHPQSMPIIGVRTVEVLFNAGLISTDRKDLTHITKSFGGPSTRSGTVAPVGA